ncbi:AAA family ATPase [Mesonia aestuariivivens]|uniref:AAA family ATPase n=1 Tax=Mesonia aestuariivivens TaxID=2796128 RepID=A0ABS6W0J3_9FLAO|nr:AAA family ATPase [Mesonia aestuariivivens]MBW2961362.1 AAA family ATPase [Mesonia aestuariivivens]
MKILKIAFKNINSLRGEHFIDFTKEPFSQNSLFAITGPTGSGKTTILDVISLALFNQVPRLGKLSTTEVLKKGAILTRNQKEAYTKVTYECKEGVFSSTWEISTARTGNLRDYHMELVNLESGHLDLKKSDVPSKNEELIGLNYDQFIKSVVLAQGEFAKFLKVPKKERGALLEKITGTQIYRQIGQQAFLKYKEIGNQIDGKRIKIENFKEQLLAEEIYFEKKTKAETLQLEKKNLKLSIEKNSEAIQLKEKLKEQQQQLTTTEKEIEQVNLKNTEFEKEKGKKLQQHQEVLFFTDDFNAWQNLQQEQKNKVEEISNTKLTIKGFKEKQTQLQTEFSSHFQLEINPENASSNITTYKEKIRKLISERSELLSIYKTLEHNISGLVKDFQFNAKPFNANLFQQELKEKQTEKSSVFEKLNEKFQLQNKSIFSWEEEIQEQLKMIRAAEKEEFQLDQLQKEIQQKKNELEKLENSLKNSPQKINQLQQNLTLKKIQLEAKQKTLEVEQLQKKLEDYRNELKENEACPLCGSVHHPFASEHPQSENNLKKEVEQLIKEIQQLQTELTREETQLENSQNLQKQTQEQFRLNELKFLKHQQVFKEKFTSILPKKQEQSFSAMETKLEAELNELNHAKQLQEDLEKLKELAQKAKELAALITNGKAKSEAIEFLFKGTDFEKEIGEIETSWNRNEQNISQQKELLITTEKILVKVEEKFKELNETLLDQLQAKGYSSVEKALSLKLSATEAQQWLEDQEQLKNNKIKLETLQQKLKEDIEVLSEKESETTLEQLKELLLQENKTLTQKENDFNELLRLLKNQEENLKQIEKLQNEVGKELEQSEHWKVLNDLIGDKTGNKFNDFAQDLTLAQLLQLANKRLENLSDRYRIDQPTDDEDDSLVAIDEHMGGQRRSIKTLSGGETFILSLALALALSDLASRNIEINSLFIDEGFGTLDPETLDQTLDTLEILQTESSKMIGIISHVESLKERIATQIQLTQNGQGYSSLTII